MKRFLLWVVVLNLLQQLAIAQNHKISAVPNRTIDSLLTVLKTAKEDTNKVWVLNKLSREYTNLSEYSKSMLYSKEAIKIASAIESATSQAAVKKAAQKGRANAYNNIGIIYNEQGSFDKALESHFASLKINEELQDKKGISASMNNMGLIYDKQGNNDKALESHLASLKIKEETGDKKGAAASFNNLGLIYHKQGNYEKALEFQFKALKLGEEIGNKGVIGNAYNNMGNIYNSQGKNEKALESYFASLKIKEANGDKKGIAVANNNIGNIYLRQNKIEEARKTLFASLSIAKEIGLKERMKRSYELLSLCDSATGNWKGAFEYHRLYSQINDSMFNEQSSKQIAEMQTKYDTEKKEQEIILLTKDKALQQSILLQQLLLGKQNENEINILNKDKEIKTLALSQRESDLRRQKLETEAKAKEVTLLNKDKEIKGEVHKAALEKQTMQRNGFIAGFALMLTLAGMSYRSYRNKRNAHEIIKLQKAEVEHQKSLVDEKNRDITDSINYAKRLQQAILPSEKSVKENLNDSFIVYNAKDIVAGDFYWMEKKEELVFFAAADCTGHGVPGAIVSVVCSNALNRTVKEFGLTVPSKILDKVRELVIETFEKSESEVKDGMDISLCAINKRTNEITWAGANNPLWYVSNDELKEIKPDKQPIGKHEAARPFTSHTLQLNKGDLIYLFTDGFADQFGGRKGKKFMTKNMKELFLSIAQKPLSEQKEILNTTFLEWKGNLEQVDDVCIVGVRI